MRRALLRPEDRFESAAEFADALKPFAGGAGKGYTAMMPKNANAVLEQASKQHAAALQASKGPASTFKSPAKTVKMVQQPQAAVARPAPAPAPPVKAPARAEAKPLLLVGIAAGCLIAGILITIVAMRLFQG